MDEGRKRVLGFIAGILVARHQDGRRPARNPLKPEKRNLVVAAAVQWAEKIVRKVDSLAGASK